MWSAMCTVWLQRTSAFCSAILMPTNIQAAWDEYNNTILDSIKGKCKFSINCELVKNLRVIITSFEQLISVGDTLSSVHTLLRRQFLLTPAYVTTFWHSCQQLTLKKVANDFTTPVFTPRQLYTVLSQVRHRNVYYYQLWNCEQITMNVMYGGLLCNNDVSYIQECIPIWPASVSAETASWMTLTTELLSNKQQLYSNVVESQR